MRRDDSFGAPSGSPDGTCCARGEKLPDGFAESLVSLVASGGAGRGVTALCEARLFEQAVGLLFRANRIVIVTGFFIPSCTAPETDGPGGSVVLGRALLRLGKDVRLATDSSCFDALAACSGRIGGPPVLRIDSPEALLSESFDLLVYIERVGRASDGRYYNMRCEDVSSWVVPLDDAASAALGSGIPVLAVGDGGNEAGMGVFRGPARRSDSFVFPVLFRRFRDVRAPGGRFDVGRVRPCGGGVRTSGAPTRAQRG